MKEIKSQVVAYLKKTKCLFMVCIMLGAKKTLFFIKKKIQNLPVHRQPTY